MKTLPRVRRHAPRVRRRAPSMPKIWIWTFKIMPDLWLSAVFCPSKKKKSLHPTVYDSSPLVISNSDTSILFITPLPPPMSGGRGGTLFFWAGDKMSQFREHDYTTFPIIMLTISIDQRGHTHKNPDDHLSSHCQKNHS